MDEVARIVLALEEHDVAEEVMHFLDRSGRARVVATASDARQLAEAVRQLEPDAVIARPGLVLPGALAGHTLLAVDTAESIATLRAAIGACARGFYVWPADREELAAAASSTRARVEVGERRAVVVAVYGPRGGSGTTFVAAHLAAAIARRGSECVLVDADSVFADLTVACGVTSGDEAEPRTLADLAPLADELSAEHLDEVLWRHAEGFRLLLAPPAEAAAQVGGELVAAAVESAARAADVVLVHLPRALEGVTLDAFAQADRVLVVLSLDVLSFRAAKRALELAPPMEADFVVNRAARAEVTPGDVEKVFGRAPLAVVPFDAGAQRAQDEGRLLPRRGRTGRAFDRLAGRILEGRG